jgi:molybdopterin-guanine dinucleotide biosynthesis protein A
VAVLEPLPRTDITGLVLAGGRGSRMGGVDKGLQPWQGQPLVQHALQRLAPQVGPLMVNANRNLDAYRAFGVPVWPDEMPDHPGPLAGFLAGLQHCRTPWLVTVPCDSPRFPADLVRRLADALQHAGADLALAATREGDRLQPQPVFCLLRTSLRDDLRAFLHQGGRKIDAWTGRQRQVVVAFDDAGAFFNANTPEDLRAG